MPQTELQRILTKASEYLRGLIGHELDVVDIKKPLDTEYAVHLSKVISKLSPMLGNTIEYRVVAELNKQTDWPEGRWMRQDPGFPDTVFIGNVSPTPGIEIKTWFPFATEITARFKDSITHFSEDQTLVAMIAWIPNGVIYGCPRILDIWIDTAKSVAMARDTHYHRPPDYLVFEPEDTTLRTKNLQQTNTAGYKFQGTPQQRREAEQIVASWGASGRVFSHSPEYQALLRTLLGRFTYRLDTNFSKMDRIGHPTLEAFKTKVANTIIRQRTVTQWRRILKRSDTPTNVRFIGELIA